MKPETGPEGRDALIELSRRSALGQMAASFAHQMRSPLQTIRTRAEILTETTQNADQVRENAGHIAKNVERLDRLIEAMLNLARSGTPQLESGRLDQTVNMALTPLEGLAREKGIQVVKDFQETAPCRMDLDYLQGAIYNILANAIEAMPAGGVLKICLAQTGAKIELKIEDTGVGIEKSLAAQIGRPFFSTKEKGTGLGLYTTRQILAYHEADLSWISKKNKGTSVTMTFPCAPPS